jgi:PadR family transcriptional regulator AphA
MEISPTGYVVLGILNWGAHTGYEIKQVTDRSTRFFWVASYGQIYPELKRLEAQGMVTGESDPQDGRRRTLYSLTAKGRRELVAWLRRPPETFEARNEGLLKLFLSSALPPEDQGRQLAEMGRQSAEVASQLREIEDKVDRDGLPYLCLRYGIEINEWIVEWCRREKRALDRRAAKRRAA